MLVDFNALSEESKVWIYPCNRKFYPKEIDVLNNQLKTFVENWKLTDENFKASFEIRYNRFIIFLAAEDAILSNNDIDAQVGFILQLQAQYNVELLDRMNVCFKQGEYTQYKELKDFKKLIKDKAVTEKTVVFDNLIETKQELDNYWEVPISESWYSRFLKKSKANS